MQVPINEAKTNLSRLIEASVAGEDVIIARGQKPMVRLVPVSGQFQFGVLKNHISSAPNFDEPLPAVLSHLVS